MNVWSAAVGSKGILLESTDDFSDHYMEQEIYESQIMNHKDSFFSEAKRLFSTLSVEMWSSSPPQPLVLHQCEPEEDVRQTNASDFI